MTKPVALSPLSHIPLLKIQRELCDIPRGRDRFDVYLSKMIGPRRDLALPLSAFNPMSKDHVVARLDELLEQDPERICQQAIDEANSRLGDALHARPVGLVLADDFGGGWTNRYQMEAGARFGKVTRIEHDWLVVLLWSSERPTVDELRREILAHIYRGQYRLTHGQPQTLAKMLSQEGAAMRFAEFPLSTFTAAEWQAARQVIDQHRGTADHPTAFACLYGDDAAMSVGYSAVGMPNRGGFAIALEEARQVKERPEALLR